MGNLEKKLETMERLETKLDTIKSDTNKISNEVDTVKNELAELIDKRKTDAANIEKLDRNISDLSKEVQENSGH